MNRAPFTSFAAAIVLTLVGCASVPPQPKPQLQPQGLNFVLDQLAGSWAESSSSKSVCTDDEVRYRFEFAPDGKKLTVRLNRIHSTEIGDRDEIAASIIESSEHSLTIAYDGESRLHPDGTPLQWQLVVVAPGVYRWRETTWPAEGVNVVVGVRCTP